MILFAAVLSLSPYPATAQFEKNSFCAVMPGRHAKEKFFVDYKGERIHFCCRGCVKAFKKNPEKYWAKLDPEKIVPS